MLHSGFNLVSLNDFIRHCCVLKDKDSINIIGNIFCKLITSKYMLDGNACFKAEAEDKTRHLLFEIDLILEIFYDESLLNTLISRSFQENLRNLSNKQFTISTPACCCCPKKLKKHFSHSESFSEFVRKGDVEMRRFESLKYSLKYIVCLDIEAFEFDNNRLLEMGLSILNLHDNIRTNVHIIISDHYHLRNGKYVPDNRHNFNFGNSLHMNLGAAVDYVFKWLDLPNTCLLGHNIKADIQFLRKASVKKVDLPVFDTQIIFQQYKVVDYCSSLQKVMEDLQMPHENLHNAGNDAFYTLEVFKRLARL